MSDDLVKVAFALEPGAWHGSATERLWALPVTPGLFRLENSPFYALGVSYQDIVSAVDDGSGLKFTTVNTRGGHSTYRILPRAGRSEVESYWTPLQAAGCSYEEGEKGLRAVDVPPSASIGEVYRLLQAGETAGAWYFEEGHCGHPVA